MAGGMSPTATPLWRCPPRTYFQHQKNLYKTPTNKQPRKKKPKPTSKRTNPHLTIKQNQKKNSLNPCSKTTQKMPKTKRHRPNNKKPTFTDITRIINNIKATTKQQQYKAAHQIKRLLRNHLKLGPDQCTKIIRLLIKSQTS